MATSMPACFTPTCGPWLPHNFTLASRPWWPWLPQCQHVSHQHVDHGYQSFSMFFHLHLPQQVRHHPKYTARCHSLIPRPSPAPSLQLHTWPLNQAGEGLVPLLDMQSNCKVLGGLDHDACGLSFSNYCNSGARPFPAFPRGVQRSLCGIAGDGLGEAT